LQASTKYELYVDSFAIATKRLNPLDFATAWSVLHNLKLFPLQENSKPRAATRNVRIPYVKKHSVIRKQKCAHPMPENCWPVLREISDDQLCNGFIPEWMYNCWLLPD